MHRLRFFFSDVLPTLLPAMPLLPTDEASMESSINDDDCDGVARSAAHADDEDMPSEPRSPTLSG